MLQLAVTALWIFFFNLSPLQFVQPVVGMSEMKCQRKQFLELRKK